MRPFRFVVEYFDRKTGSCRGSREFAAVVPYDAAGGDFVAELHDVVESLRQERESGRLRGVQGKYDKDDFVMVVRQQGSGRPRLIP